MNKFSSLALEAIKEYSMFNKNDKVLIALSGGKDSVALLLFLCEFQKYLSIELYAAHVNHMIRGNDADEDQKFCKELCNKLGITYFTQSFDVPEIAKTTNTSLEEAARNVRYSYFNSVCEKYGINKIATAHTASDNTETVIYNIMRGTGTQGICGIPPKRDNIVRPLILCTKEETQEYCVNRNVSFCIDKTNNDDVYDRNNIRLNIIPHIKKRNPSIDRSSARLSYLARCDRELIEYAASEFLKKHNGELPLNETADFFAETKFVSCAHHILSQKCGKTLPFEIFSQCRDIIISKKVGKQVNLFDDVYLVINYDKIEIKSITNKPSYYECKLETATSVQVNPRYKITLLNGENCINYKNINNLTKTATFNSDKIYGDIFARMKIDGDRYSCCGMTKSLKKLFSENKISRELRPYIPVICDEKGIIWVPGMKVCDRALPSKGGNTITIIAEYTE
ncbi:MAG: tRNA lysidine(34) synthetase TilS [Ruminococcaceae bacterium]|nr:tRNA lysidine(34) synthetase TilS [Oscillospiraceae bacterium]